MKCLCQIPKPIAPRISLTTRVIAAQSVRGGPVDIMVGGEVVRTVTTRGELYALLVALVQAMPGMPE